MNSFYFGYDESATMIGQVKKLKKNMFLNELVTNKLKINLGINMLKNTTKLIGAMNFPRQLNGYYLIQKTIK